MSCRSEQRRHLRWPRGGRWRRAWLVAACCAIAAAAGACKKQPSTDTGQDEAPSVVEALANEEAPLPKQPLTVGQKVFDFTALAHTGASVKLSDFSNEPVLVYFCEPAGSQPCVDIATGIRDNWLALNPHLSMVLAVSSDDTVTLEDVSGERELSHLMLADSGGQLRRVFGLPAQLTTSYLIGRQQEVLHVFPPPLGADHAQQVLNVLKEKGLLQPLPPP